MTVLYIIIMSFSGFALAALHTSITNTQSNEQRGYLLDQSVRNQTICLTRHFSASMSRVFPILPKVTRFPALTY